MNQLPLTVIGGYLGAGKTTLINHLLTGAHGKRLMVMVNDFGAVNIDAALLANVSGDTIELTNGCVCCTMGADLFMAVGDVLDRKDRPDHLIVEASGIADPAKIAQVAQTEPDLSYAGIVTVVDAENCLDLIEDVQIGPQIEGQIKVADVLYLSKQGSPSDPLRAQLAALSSANLVTEPDALGPLLWAQTGAVPEVPEQGHAHFVKWGAQDAFAGSRADLIEKLQTRPVGLYRVKGFVAAQDGALLVQVVGQSVSVTGLGDPVATNLVGIGVSGQVTQQEIEAWWCDKRCN